MIAETLSLTDVAILATLFIFVTLMVVVLYLKMVPTDQAPSGSAERGDHSVTRDQSKAKSTRSKLAGDH
ncbi:MAG: hypothetical protein HKN91_11905 [Acidimicrobiia bacterium]|nr:hypothetical protein [Acidimicrobiia bacterium]